MIIGNRLSCFYLSRGYELVPIFLLLALSPKWNRLAYILQTIGRNHKTLSKTAKEHLRRWFLQYNRAFIAPTSRQMTELAANLEAARLFITDSQYNELNEIFESFKKRMHK